MNSNGMQELTDRLSHYMKTWGMGLEDAMSEIVADSCDQILANETVMQHIQETDKNLYTEVKGFVKNLVERIKQAVTGMSGSASRDARALAQSANEIAKVWLGAYDEALTGVAAEGRENDKIRDIRTETHEKYKGESLYTDSSIYDYDFLVTLPDIEIVSVPSDIGKYITEENAMDTKQIRQDGLKNAEQYGTVLPDGAGVIIKNKYTGRDMRVTGKSVIHGVHKSVDMRSQANTRAALNIGRLALEAVPINGLKTTEPNVLGTYAMVAPIARNNNVKGVALLTVEIRTGTVLGVDLFDQIHSENTRKNSGAGISANALAPLSTNQETDSTSTSATSKISIKEFLKVVNDTYPDILSENVLQHFDNEEAQGYWKNRKLFSQAELADKNNEGASVGSMVDAIDNMEQADSPSTPDIINDMASLVKLDQEYEDAANRGDIKKTTEMLLKKLADTQGVIPFIAPEWDTGEARTTAKLLKVADPEAIATAADKMSVYVPDNAVLIPMPGHEGKLTADSWSVKLAEAISERTGRPVVIALEGAEHESRQEAKHRGEKGVGREALGFRQVEDLPDGTFPIFVDNVIGTGVTADAAMQAVGGGITLAYTKTLRAPGLPGLKNLVVTHESQKNGGGLIPLSERLNTEKRDVRYSKAELDDRYMQAVEQMPDTDSEGNKLTDAQREFFKGSKAVDSEGRLLQLYHGTPSGGFRTFNNKKGTYWFAETRETARTYSKIVGDIAPSRGQELDATDQWLEEMNGGIYVSYLDMKNPQVIDAKRAKWDNIVIDGQKWSTDELAGRAKQEGYDGLIIRNVMDEGDYRNPLNPTYSNVYAVFRPNQIKSVNNTDPTQDNDIRWSRSEESYDVEAWLGNMTYSGLQTEDERILMETFKGLRVSMSLALHKQVLYQSRIKELESRTVLDADARHELETLRQKLEGQRWRMGQLEKEMADVTSQEGYAGMMYKHNMLFKDFIDGKTQEQVTEKVNELMAQVKDANRDIEKQTAEMRKLVQTQAVKTMKSYLGKTSLDRMATTLKKQYNSAMPKTEVEDRLAYMALKLADGQDIQADAEGLAAE